MSGPDMSNIYENLPDNSHKARAEKSTTAPAPTGKRVEKVVTGKVKTKKNEMRKLTDIFISDDISNVKEHILLDVLAPAIKKALYDAVVNSLDMVLYGGRRNKRSTADRVSYRDYSSVSRDERSYNRTRTTTGYSYDDVVLYTRGDAEAVLTRMDEIMEQYDVVRVADLYDLVGITGEHTDNKYGWTNIRNAEVVSLRDGTYTIKMPRAVPLPR